MHVQDAIGKPIEERGRQQAHEAGEADQFDARLVKRVRQRRVIGRAGGPLPMRHLARRNPRSLRALEPSRTGDVGDHDRDRRAQAPLRDRVDDRLEVGTSPGDEHANPRRRRVFHNGVGSVSRNCDTTTSHDRSFCDPPLPADPASRLLPRLHYASQTTVWNGWICFPCAESRRAPRRSVRRLPTTTTHSCGFCDVPSTSGRSGYWVFARCRTHFHLLVWPENDQQLPRFMHWLTATHAMRWRDATDTIGEGAVYQGRYKADPGADRRALSARRALRRAQSATREAGRESGGLALEQFVASRSRQGSAFRSQNGRSIGRRIGSTM